jgi:membrane protein implicated in regulation of membrane protease activity
MNYLAWCIGFTVVAFGNFVLALRGDLWWVHALLAIACTAAAIHAARWARKTRRTP